MRFKTNLFMIISCMAITLALSSSVSSVAAKVKDYRIETVGLYTEDKKLARIAIRRFHLNGIQYYLAVNPVTLDTELVPAGRYLIQNISLGNIRTRYSKLAYCRAITLAEANSRQLRNAGISRIPGGAPDVFLTADLCPTKLLLDRVLFTRIISDYGSKHRPVPVALALSGVWIDKHRNDLQWLKKLIIRKDLVVTWINHTYNHKYYKRVPWWKNFLLDKRVRVNDEIIRNEITMIESGLVPSIFFRFPGLVSNKDLFRQVTDFGLIPIGSDAWLGKKQWPENGSIILVHANGQEPVGIKRFLWLLGNKKQEIAAGRWVFSDLRVGLSRALKMY